MSKSGLSGETAFPERARFQQLRQRQDAKVLTGAEQVERASLIQELEAAEAAYRAPVLQRLRQEREALEAENRALEALAHRKEALVQRLRTRAIEKGSAAKPRTRD